MQVWIELLLGEKDGQRFLCPWKDTTNLPKLFYATTESGDEELMAYRGEPPPGRKEELSILAYQYSDELRRGPGLKDIRYKRAPRFDIPETAPKPVARKRAARKMPPKAQTD